MSDARRILVTGVTKGLGRAMTEKFIALGHHVAGCGRSASAIEQLQESHPEDHFSIVDIADDADVAHWAETVIDEFGVPDLIVNNAATINRSAALWKLPAGEFDQVIDVNIKGVTNVIRHFLPAMIEAGRGMIINFSSGWGRSVSAEVAPYCATKWAIEGLTKALAEELPSGLGAVPLNPGIINTDMLQSCFGESASSFPDARQWAEQAAPYILSLAPKHSGHSLSVG